MAEVVTGEAVILDLAVARFPSRMAALLLDMLVQIVVIVAALLVIFSGLAPQLDAAGTAAIWSICYAAVVIGYPTIFETVTRGKTLGKMALGIRVVSDDGSPVRFRQALLRALSLAFVEVWNPAFAIIGMPAGLITAMISARGKRLGDLIAGTFVITERVPIRPDLHESFATVPPPLAGWAQNLELSRLSDATAAAASSYLRRFNDLRPAARDALGWQLAGSVAAQVSPPPPAGTPPAAYLAAVLAVRRQRETARLLAQQVAQPTAGHQPGAGYQPGAVYHSGATCQPQPAQFPVPPPGAAHGGQADPLPAYEPGILPALPPTRAGQAGKADDVGPGDAQPATPPRQTTEPDNHGFTAPV